MPTACVVGALTWDIEEAIRQALPGDPDPGPNPDPRAATRGAIIHWAHTVRFPCHPGVSRTINLHKPQFWWKSLVKDVKDQVSACATCAYNKVSTKHPAGLHHIIFGVANGFGAGSTKLSCGPRNDGHAMRTTTPAYQPGQKVWLAAKNIPL